MSIKSKIQQNIVTPIDHNSNTYAAVAQVIDSNEKANTVSVKFIDKDGKVNIQHNIPVKIYNTAIIDWFPSEGESVVISQNDNYICVTSKYEGSYSSYTRGATLLKNDIFGESFNSIVAGNIL